MIPRQDNPILTRLRLPVVAAPMLLVSGPELVIAACRAGVLGAFPVWNAREDGELDDWFMQLEGAEAAASDTASDTAFAPFAPNLIVHETNPRLEAQLQVILEHRPPVVITSVGSPSKVVARIQEAGIQVWADVASVRHAQRSIDAGVDGLILLTAGAGGNTGYANPFAFVRSVRARYDGVIALAGGQADGWCVWAAEGLGCDLSYMGTRFIATTESRAPEDYKQMIVSSELDDIHLTSAFSGIPMSVLRPSLLAQGLNPDDLEGSSRGFAGVASMPGHQQKRYREVWSAGHSVSVIRDLSPVADVVDRLVREYLLAARDQQSGRYGATTLPG